MIKNASNFLDAIDVTAGVIRKDGRILVSRRTPGSHLEGLWEFPGGKREAGETLRECLAREIREELDLAVQPVSLIMTAAHEYEDKSVVLHFFECRVLSGEPRAVHGQEFRWVAPHELRELEFPPPDGELVERLAAPPPGLRP